MYDHVLPYMGEGHCAIFSNLALVDHEECADHSDLAPFAPIVGLHPNFLEMIQLAGVGTPLSKHIPLPCYKHNYHVLHTYMYSCDSLGESEHVSFNHS